MQYILFLNVSARDQQGLYNFISMCHVQMLMANSSKLQAPLQKEIIRFESFLTRPPTIDMQFLRSVNSQIQTVIYSQGKECIECIGVEKQQHVIIRRYWFYITVHVVLDKINDTMHSNSLTYILTPNDEQVIILLQAMEKHIHTIAARNSNR